MSLATIQKRLATLEKLEQENKVARQMLKEELEQNEAYMAVNAEQKAAATQKKNLKEEILATGSNQEMVAKIEENNEEIKTLREILNTELVEYYAKERVDELQDSNGQTRKFKISIRFLPARNFS